MSLVNSQTKNVDQRIFQGNVDTEINQLTQLGKSQAEQAATKLEEQLLSHDWIPNIIFYSPLTRAKETGLPFVKRNNFQDIYVPHEGIREISFGKWDNKRVCDVKPTESCHAFYQHQNALVRTVDAKSHDNSESFCDVLQRAHGVLMELNERHSNKKIIMFSHSMFGAACAILLGKGQRIEDGEYLAFDGKRLNGESYTMPHATPFLLHAEVAKLKLVCQ